MKVCDTKTIIFIPLNISLNLPEIFNRFSILLIMKLLLDINDNQASFFIEVLKNFSFVKTTQLTESKAEFLDDLKNSVDEIKLAKEGEIELQSAKDLINEL